jgi:uncharacterized membrane protein YfcA
MGTALGAVMLSAALGVTSQRKHVHLVPSLFLGGSGMLMAPFGRYMGGQIDDLILLLLFFLISTLIAVGMWLKANQDEYSRSRFAYISHYSILDVPRLRDFFPVSNTSLSHKSFAVRLFTSMQMTLCGNVGVLFTLCLWGSAVGVLSGLLGIGGGVFIIPILRYGLNMNMRAALASSLLVIVMVSFSGFFTSLMIYPEIELWLLSRLSVSAMLGIYLGHRVGLLLPEKILQRVFSVSLIMISAFAVYAGI